MSGTGSNPKVTIYHFLWSILDWLYPPICGGCNQPGYVWCPSCQSSLKPIGPYICQKCGDRVNNRIFCPRCTLKQPSYNALRSCAMYEGSLKKAIQSLKFRNNTSLGEPLSLNLVTLLNSLHWKIDLIIPVPLSSRRKIERGYNQVNLLAFPLALKCNIPIKSKALTRIRETHAQVGLNIRERQENVKDAFLGNQFLVENKAVLVVDDVATTGSTIESCSKALLEAGASIVYGLTLARALYKSDNKIDAESSDN